jgi:asparagine synthetase A
MKSFGCSVVFAVAKHSGYFLFPAVQSFTQRPKWSKRTLLKLFDFIKQFENVFFAAMAILRPDPEQIVQFVAEIVDTFNCWLCLKILG